MTRGERRRAIHQVLQEVVDALDDVERPVLARMLIPLEQAQREVERDLMFWLRRQDGDARFTTQRYRSALTQIRAGLDHIKGLAPVVAEALDDAGAIVAAMAPEHVERQIVRLGQLFEPNAVQPVSIDAGIVIARGDEILIDRFATSARRYAGEARDKIVNELVVSRVRGESIFEMTDRLQRQLPSVFQANRSSAERLARTEVMNAYNVYHVEALREAQEDDPEMVARWDSSFDTRRCEICRSLDGQTANVVKGETFVAVWTRHTRKGARTSRLVVKRPPAHPWCRCVLIPWRKHWPDYARDHNPR